MADVATTYFTVQGDSPQTVKAAVGVLQYHGLAGLVEAQSLGRAMTFGSTYNRVVRDNVDRALWALLQQGDKEAAKRWADQARAALRK